MKHQKIEFIISKLQKNFVIDVPNSSKEDCANLIIFTNYGTSNQKFIITKVSDNKYTIKCVRSGKWWKSGGTKGQYSLKPALQPTIAQQPLQSQSKQMDKIIREK